MIKSMTGFGRAEYSDEKRNITVEIKSVNHRYSDINVKMPRRYQFAEEAVKAAVKETVKRGKVDVSISVENLGEDELSIKLNTPVARQYYENLQVLADEFGFERNVSLQFLATLPDVMKASAEVQDEEEIVKALLIPVREAGRKHDEMRVIEGKKLAEDLINRGELIREIAKKIEERSEVVVKNYSVKLKDRITELLEGSVTVPEDRIMLEAAIFADKANITEELVRLDSHTMQLKNILNEGKDGDGKKLDFLVQEMNREANTIGSKANDIEITNLMLEVKAEVEKIREQVQNIE